MHNEFKFARYKYKIYKEEEKKKTEKDSQKSLIGQEIDSLKLLIAENVRTADLLETD